MTVKEMLERMSSMELTEWAIWMDMKAKEQKKAQEDAARKVR
jgi:hypothetical protein